MLPAHASATTPRAPAVQAASTRATTSTAAALLGLYHEHLRRCGGRPAAYWSGARAFFARWPDPACWAAEPLAVRLSANAPTSALIRFLMLQGLLHPGYDLSLIHI